MIRPGFFIAFFVALVIDYNAFASYTSLTGDYFPIQINDVEIITTNSDGLTFDVELYTVKTVKSNGKTFVLSRDGDKMCDKFVVARHVKRGLVVDDSSSNASIVVMVVRGDGADEKEDVLIITRDIASFKTVSVLEILELYSEQMNDSIGKPLTINMTNVNEQHISLLVTSLSGSTRMMHIIKIDRKSQKIAEIALIDRWKSLK